jgi:hypothetical protein
MTSLLAAPLQNYEQINKIDAALFTELMSPLVETLIKEREDFLSSALPQTSFSEGFLQSTVM